MPEGLARNGGFDRVLQTDGSSEFVLIAISEGVPVPPVDEVPHTLRIGAYDNRDGLSYEPFGFGKLYAGFLLDLTDGPRKPHPVLWVSPGASTALRAEGPGPS